MVLTTWLSCLRGARGTEVRARSGEVDNGGGLAGSTVDYPASRRSSGPLLVMAVGSEELPGVQGTAIDEEWRLNTVLLYCAGIQIR